jgi:hypothetical protein
MCDTVSIFVGSKPSFLVEVTQKVCVYQPDSLSKDVLLAKKYSNRPISKLYQSLQRIFVPEMVTLKKIIEQIDLNK